MSISTDGSGSSARSVGSRKSLAASMPDAARGEQPADDFRQAHALGDAETDAVLAAAPDPAPAAQAATDAEDAVAHKNATTDEHR